jgi:hypothetical protein
MGNKSSTETKVSSGLDESDFEKVEASAPPPPRNNNNNNEMMNSGILVEKPSAVASPLVTSNKRRIIKAMPPTPTINTSVDSKDGIMQSDEHHHQDETVITPSNDNETLQDSIDQDRQKRMQQLAADQKSKRSEKQAEGRSQPHKIEAKANPFSRFLSAFSVDTKYPNHKRTHDDEGSDEPPPKQPRTDDYNSTSDSQDFFKHNLPYIAAAAVASVVMMLVFRKKC